MKLEQINKQIEKLEEKKQELLEKQSKNGVVGTVKVDGVLYEVKDHSQGKKLNKIKIPNGWRLWTYEECIKLHNDLKLRRQLNLKDCWFFIKQPFEFNKEKNYVAWFGANSDWAYLVATGVAAVSSADLGVRLAKNLGKK